MPCGRSLEECQEDQRLVRQLLERQVVALESLNSSLASLLDPEKLREHLTYVAALIHGGV